MKTFSCREILVKLQKTKQKGKKKIKAAGVNKKKNENKKLLWKNQRDQHFYLLKHKNESQMSMEWFIPSCILGGRKEGPGGDRRGTSGLLSLLYFLTWVCSRGYLLCDKASCYVFPCRQHFAACSLVVHNPFQGKIVVQRILSDY